MPKKPLCNNARRFWCIDTSVANIAEGNSCPHYGACTAKSADLAKNIAFPYTSCARRTTRFSGLHPASTRCFHPRPPCGGRHERSFAIMVRLQFLSSPSVRRATCTAVAGALMREVSILALHTEGDGVGGHHANARLVSILALHTEGDVPHGFGVYGAGVPFLSCPPYGGRHILSSSS